MRPVLMITRYQNKLVHEAPEILYQAASSSQQRENNHDQGRAGHQSPDSGKGNIIGTFYTERTNRTPEEESVVTAWRPYIKQ